MSDSESDDGLRALPAGVLRPYKGWAGSELEASRTMAASDEGDREPKTLKDGFQNKEVGVGYQYKSVVRQKTGMGTTTGPVVDMMGGGGEKQQRIHGARERGVMLMCQESPSIIGYVTARRR